MLTHEHQVAIQVAQEAARAGQKPSTIFALLVDHIESDRPDHVPIISIEFCLMNAFQIPLREARNIEMWQRLYSLGSATDEDMDQLFQPWIDKFLQRQG